MKIKLLRKNEVISKSLEMPGDKSIAHRALIIGALGRGQYKVENFPNSMDCLSTLNCMIKLGVTAKVEQNTIFLSTPGYNDFCKHSGLLNANNSGTTARLLSGLTAGCGIECVIDGDASLRNRPMNRVILPLKEMGAEIETSDGKLPLRIKGKNKLNGISYKMPVDSAQVKSCILISGFMAEGQTTVIERKATRDHTERMFKALGADINANGKNITIRNSPIQVKDMYIPGDISSAAFLIAYVLLSDNSELKLNKMLLNERRRKYLELLIKMGANLEYKVLETINNEEIGYIVAKSSKLNGIIIPSEDVPNIIDEIPMLSVLASFSRGTTVIEGISELKYKESNRIKSIADNLNQIGAEFEYSDEFIRICGSDTTINKDICINPHNDHRIALAFAIVAARNTGATIIEDWECTNISFPNSLQYFNEFLDVHM